MNAHVMNSRRDLDVERHAGPGAHVAMGLALAGGAVLASMLVAHAYREDQTFDQYDAEYADTFKGGKKVTLVGVSIDSDTALISWAKDAKFQFHFAAEGGRTKGRDVQRPPAKHRAGRGAARRGRAGADAGRRGRACRAAP